jgi:hypothetical protein
LGACFTQKDGREEIETMEKQLGPIEFECDAPPYPIVRASKNVGISTPEDVRWIHLSGFLETDAASTANCSCGETLPERRKVIFAFNPEGQMRFVRMGQCGGCRTVYWDMPDLLDRK